MKSVDLSTQKLNNRKEMRAKKKLIPQAKRMGRGGKETSQRFLLVAAKRKHNTFLSTFILSFNDFCMTRIKM